MKILNEKHWRRHGRRATGKGGSVLYYHSPHALEELLEAQARVSMAEGKVEALRELCRKFGRMENAETGDEEFYIDADKFRELHLAAVAELEKLG